MQHCYVLPAGQALLNAYFGQGTGPIVMDNVQCAGNENQLLACSSSRLLTFSSNCLHSEDAGVRCEGIASYTHNSVVLVKGFVAFIVN